MVLLSSSVGIVIALLVALIQEHKQDKKEREALDQLTRSHAEEINRLRALRRLVAVKDAPKPAKHKPWPFPVSPPPAPKQQQFDSASWPSDNL